MRFIFILAAFFCCTSVIAQEGQNVHPVGDSTYVKVEKMAVFPGGEQAMYDFLRNNIKYPYKARKKNITGKVYVNFTIDKNGDIQKVFVLKGIGHGCDEEAVRVIQAMPRWIPAEMKGQPVAVSNNMPINFSLR